MEQDLMIKPAGIVWLHDPNGKLDIAHDAGYWLRDENGVLTKNIKTYLLGWMHVPERSNGETTNLE